jgi:fido (protein-threonine AMPylation protein)
MNPTESEYVLASLELLKTKIQTAQGPHQLFYRLREVHHAIFSSFYNFLVKLRKVVNGLNGLSEILLQERDHRKYSSSWIIMSEIEDTMRKVNRHILESKELDKQINPLTNAMMYYSIVNHPFGEFNGVDIDLIDRFVGSLMYVRNADNTFSPFSQHFLAFCKTFKHGVIDRTTELDQVDWTFVACKLNLVDNSDQLKELFKSFVLPLRIMELPLPTPDSHNYVDWVGFKARMIERILSNFFSGSTAQTLRRVDPPPQPSWLKRQRTSVVRIARWALGRQEHPPMQFAVTDETLNCFEGYPGLLQRLVVQCATVDVKPIALDPKPISLSRKSIDTLGAIDSLGKANSTTTRLECPICYKSFERTLKTKDGDLLDFTPGCRTPKCAGWQICKDCLHSALHTHNLSTCSQCRTDWGTRPISRVIKMEEGFPSFVGVDPRVDIPLLSKRLGKMDQSFNGIVGQNITHALSFVETCDEADKCPGLGFPQFILDNGRKLRARLAAFNARDIAHALRQSQAELDQLINPRETDVTGPDTEQGPEQGDKRGRSSGGTRFKKQRHQKHKRTKKRNVH